MPKSQKNNYTPAFKAKSARTNPTFHAVVRSVSLHGFGIEPFLTPRQQEAEEMPYNPIKTGKRI